jgi:hypothetical protein
VCYYHGGAAPQNLEAARRRIADPFGLLAYELLLLELDEPEHPMDVGDPD